jgi:putative aldouronate transport system substrate-binding protein
MPWTGEAIVWDGFGADLGMKNDPTMPVYAEYLKTTGNARIEWQTFPWNDYDQKLNLYLQSGDLPDIMWARDAPAKVVLFGGTGMFLDWDKYKDRMPNMTRWIDTFPHLSNVLTKNKERFVIQDVANAEYIGEGWFYNPTVLGKAGITKPPTTIEEMIAQMKQVKAKVPGADGFLSYFGMSYTFGAFANVLNTRIGIDYNPDTKKWFYGPTMDPNYKQLLMYLNDMYKAGVFNIDALGEGVTNERVNELITAGNFAFNYSYYGSMQEYYGKYGIPTPLVGMKPPSYKGQTFYRITVPFDAGNYWGYMSPKDVKNPEVLASYVDNIMSMETYYLFEWGIEGLTYRMLPDGRPEFLESVDAAKRSELGVYNFWDPRYIHFSDYQTAWFSKNLAPGHPGHDAAVADVMRLQKGELKPIFGWPRPQMSVEVNDEISKIMTPLNTFESESRLKFITGATPFSEWDAYIAQLNKMGDIAKVLRYYTEGKNFPMGERRYPKIF